MPCSVRSLRLTACLLLAAWLSGCAGLGLGPSADTAASAQADDAPVLAAYSRLGFYPARLAPHVIRLDLPSNVSFASGSADVPAPMQRSLGTVAGPFNSPALRGWQMLVVGHADDRGNDKENEVMSLARANGVARHLVAQGTDPGRVRTEGRGEREPLASNDKGYGRDLNRRVELFLHLGPLPAGATAPR